jgi:hypothetical protein
MGGVLVRKYLAKPWHSVAERPKVKDGLLELDAARRTAAEEAHAHQGASTQIVYVLGGETEVISFLKPAASAANDLLTPVVLVGVRKRGGLTHLGCRVHQLRGFTKRAPAVHLTQDPNVPAASPALSAPPCFRLWLERSVDSSSNAKR